MDGTNKAPTANKILSILANLIADQYGVKVKVEFNVGHEEEGVRVNEQAQQR